MLLFVVIITMTMVMTSDGGKTLGKVPLQMANNEKFKSFQKTQKILISTIGLECQSLRLRQVFVCLLFICLFVLFVCLFVVRLAQELYTSMKKSPLPV
jgi:hypothetical protein